MWRWKDLGRKSPWHLAGKNLFLFVKYFDGNGYMDQAWSLVDGITKEKNDSSWEWT